MKSRNLFIWLIVIAIGGLALWYLMYTLIPTNPENANPLIVDLGKTGASLSLISVIGGLVKWILQEREDQKQTRQQELTFYSNVLDDLKSVYDLVERARLLIEAHRSAKTYGEQMRAMIGGVVTLHNVKRALKTRSSFSSDDKKFYNHIKPDINAMTRFIKNLLEEFRDHYKHISVLQGIDELQKKSLQQKESGKHQPSVVETDIPANSWKAIRQLKLVRELCDDSRYSQTYEPYFINHLVNATELIRNKMKSI